MKKEKENSINLSKYLSMTDNMMSIFNDIGYGNENISQDFNEFCNDYLRIVHKKSDGKYNLKGGYQKENKIMTDGNININFEKEDLTVDITNSTWVLTVKYEELTTSSKKSYIAVETSLVTQEEDKESLYWSLVEDNWEKAQVFSDLSLILKKIKELDPLPQKNDNLKLTNLDIYEIIILAFSECYLKNLIYNCLFEEQLKLIKKIKDLYPQIDINYLLKQILEKAKINESNTRKRCKN